MSTPFPCQHLFHVNTFSMSTPFILTPFIIIFSYVNTFSVPSQICIRAFQHLVMANVPWQVIRFMPCQHLFHVLNVWRLIKENILFHVNTFSMSTPFPCYVWRLIKENISFPYVTCEHLLCHYSMSHTCQHLLRRISHIYSLLLRVNALLRRISHIIPYCHRAFSVTPYCYVTHVPWHCDVWRLIKENISHIFPFHVTPY